MYIIPYFTAFVKHYLVLVVNEAMDDLVSVVITT